MSNETENFVSISEWQTETFPNGHALGALAHLRRELDEIEEAYASGSCEDMKDELADVFILWVAACTRLGFHVLEMEKAVTDKMGKNRRRTWGPADPDGVIEHIRAKERG